MEVAVRDLKAKLSSYLKRAAAGEQITVTDRGRPIAVIGPVGGVVDLRIGIDEGWITPASASGLPPVERQPSAWSVQRMLDEDRGA
jgi:prevent-host-death family protein